MSTVYSGREVTYCVVGSPRSSTVNSKIEDNTKQLQAKRDQKKEAKQKDRWTV